MMMKMVTACNACECFVGSITTTITHRRFPTSSNLSVSPPSLVLDLKTFPTSVSQAFVMMVTTTMTMTMATIYGYCCQLIL